MWKEQAWLGWAGPAGEGGGERACWGLEYQLRVRALAYD